MRSGRRSRRSCNICGRLRSSKKSKRLKVRVDVHATHEHPMSRRAIRVSMCAQSSRLSCPYTALGHVFRRLTLVGARIGTMGLMHACVAQASSATRITRRASQMMPQPSPSPPQIRTATRHPLTQIRKVTYPRAPVTQAPKQLMKVNRQSLRVKTRAAGTAALRLMVGSIHRTCHRYSFVCAGRTLLSHCLSLACQRGRSHPCSLMSCRKCFGSRVLASLPVVFACARHTLALWHAPLLPRTQTESRHGELNECINSQVELVVFVPLSVSGSRHGILALC